MSRRRIKVHGFEGAVTEKFYVQICSDFERLGYNISPTGLTAMICVQFCIVNQIPFTSRYESGISIIERSR